MNESEKRERKEGRPERKQVLDGNAFYEIDLECVREKARREQDKSSRTEKETDR